MPALLVHSASRCSIQHLAAAARVLDSEIGTTLRIEANVVDQLSEDLWHPAELHVNGISALTGPWLLVQLVGIVSHAEDERFGALMSFVTVIKIPNLHDLEAWGLPDLPLRLAAIPPPDICFLGAARGCGGLLDEPDGDRRKRGKLNQ